MTTQTESMKAVFAPLDVSADERALIEQMRTWKGGIPDEALGHGRQSVVYMQLMAARAELYIMALRHGQNDLRERQQQFLALISPHDILRLVRAWMDLRDRERDDELQDNATVQAVA